MDNSAGPVVVLLERTMAHKRTVEKGSFGAHLEEVVKHFPADEPNPWCERTKRDAASLRESRDIHTLLFEQAWRMNEAKGGGDSR